MLVQEMHVQFDSRLQRMNSNAFDIFYPAEKDILLNYSQNKFVRTTLPPNENNRKFEGSQKATKRYDDLQTLVTKETNVMYVLEENVLFSVLPYDFFDFITANTFLTKDCNGVTITSGTANLYIAYLPFIDDVATTDLYSDFKWTLWYNDSSSLILADKSTYTKFPVLSANDEKFLISNFAIYENNRQNTAVKVYWEKFGEIYRPNNFIFVSEAANLDKIVMNVKGALTAEASFASLNYNRYTIIQGVTKVKKETRLVPTQHVQAFLANPFQTTDSDSPITELTNNRILLHHNINFATDSLEIVYYRKPKLINYFLDVSCELHEGRHDKIIDIAVEAASAFIGNPREVKTLTNFINQSHE